MISTALVVVAIATALGIGSGPTEKAAFGQWSTMTLELRNDSRYTVEYRIRFLGPRCLEKAWDVERLGANRYARYEASEYLYQRSNKTIFFSIRFSNGRGLWREVTFRGKDKPAEVREQLPNGTWVSNTQVPPQYGRTALLASFVERGGGIELKW